MSTPIPTVLSWPLGNVEEGQLHWAFNDHSIREVMLNILLTRPGERLMRPNFGAGLLNFVHQPNNETTRHLMAGVIRKSLTQGEPRVIVESVKVEPSPTNLAEVHIAIHYQFRHNQTPGELNFALNVGQLT